MPDDQKRAWQSYISDPERAEENADRILSGLRFQPGKRGERDREEVRSFLVQVFRSGDIAGIERRYYPSNEQPEEQEQAVDAFALSRLSTLNAWYRLFDPGH